MAPILHKTGSGKLCKDTDSGKLKKHDSGSSNDCCGDCISCEDNQSPIAWKVVIDGIKNFDGPDDCKSCDELNGTYVIPLDTPISECVWLAVGVLSNDCTLTAVYRSIKVIATSFVGSYTMSVEMDLSPPGIPESLFFQEGYGPYKPDCVNLNGETITVAINHMFDCDGSVATCKITAL